MPALPVAVDQTARYELALAYRAVGKSDRADEILASLSRDTNGPVAGNAQFMLGQSHLAARRYREAIPLLEAYLNTDPRGEVADAALAHLAAAQVGLLEMEEAWKTLAMLAQRFPQSKSLAATRFAWPRPRWPRIRPRPRGAVPAGCRPPGYRRDRQIDHPRPDRPT